MKSQSGRSLPQYLYAHRPRNTFKFRLPGMQKFEYFPANTSEADAVALFLEVRAQYEVQTGQVRTDGKRATVYYAKRWRTEVLPTLITRRGKKPLAEKTRYEYANLCKRVIEQMPELRASPDEVRAVHVRAALAPWLDRPRQYNYLIVLLTHIFRYCVKLAVCEESPMVFIESEPVAKREVHVEDADYRRIREAAENEWQRRMFDLIYLVTGRPTTVLGLRDDMIHDGIIHFGETKNDQRRIELEMNDALAETVEWLRAAKRKAGLISPHLVVYIPAYVHRNWRSRLRGKPVTEEFVSKKFADAVIAAGYPKSKFVLYDLRAKGVTDEVISGGEQNKGAHRDLRTRDKHYVRVQPTVKIRNTLGLIK